MSNVAEKLNKRMTVKTVRETKKAKLVESADGRQAWMQKRWVAEGSTVNAETFDRNAKQVEERKAADEEEKAFRNDFHSLGQIARETEKAIAIQATVVEEFSDQAIKRFAWFPKSQVRDGQAPGWLFIAKAEQLVDENRMPNGGCYTVEIAGMEF